MESGPEITHLGVSTWMVPWPGFPRKQSRKQKAHAPSFYSAEQPQGAGREGGRENEEGGLPEGCFTELATINCPCRIMGCDLEMPGAIIGGEEGGRIYPVFLSSHWLKLYPTGH